jgi:hypothetical protein
MDLGFVFVLAQLGMSQEVEITGIQASQNTSLAFCGAKVSTGWSSSEVS